jgi:chromosome segregation and condensation protein ScpB
MIRLKISCRDGKMNQNELLEQIGLRSGITQSELQKRTGTNISLMLTRLRYKRLIRRERYKGTWKLYKNDTNE